MLIQSYLIIFFSLISHLPSLVFFIIPLYVPKERMANRYEWLVRWSSLFEILAASQQSKEQQLSGFIHSGILFQTSACIGPRGIKL